MHGNKVIQYRHNYKRHNLTKIILENSYRVLQVTYKWKTLKQFVCFLKADEFCPTFDTQIDITLVIFREKLQNHTFKKSNRSLSKCTNIHINRSTHYEITVFMRLLFQNKSCCILNFWWIKYLGRQILSYLKNWGIGVSYCLNYGPSRLLLHFIEYCLDQLNNKHTK